MGFLGKTSRLLIFFAQIPADIPVRLIDGRDNSEGRVEVFHDEEWHTVCDDSFGAPEADVVCKTLGFVDGGSTEGTKLPHPFGAGVGRISKISCQGGEPQLRDCSIARTFCKHHEDVGVVCQK